MNHATMEDFKDFNDKCLGMLDLQVFKLETEEAKICAIQAVQRVLREYLINCGESFVLTIIRHPVRIIHANIDKRKRRCRSK